MCPFVMQKKTLIPFLLLLLRCSTLILLIYFYLHLRTILSIPLKHSFSNKSLGLGERMTENPCERGVKVSSQEKVLVRNPSLKCIFHPSYHEFINDHVSDYLSCVSFLVVGLRWIRFIVWHDIKGGLCHIIQCLNCIRWILDEL